MSKKEKKIAIFGAGLYGMRALDKYGTEVSLFIDNAKEKQGTEIQGIPIVSMQEFLPLSDEYHVIIASSAIMAMERQLKQNHVTDYEGFYDSDPRLSKQDELVFNPYQESCQRNLTEREYNDQLSKSWHVETISQTVEAYIEKQASYDLVEIETTNQCNGNCDFCPVSKKNRHEEKLLIMPEDLFRSIISQLKEQNYSGRLALFCNNEPFIDPNIIERHRYARTMLPNSRMHLYTNGTLLTLQKFLDVVEVLDELIIDNYQEDLELIRPCQEIVHYSKSHPEKELWKKVTIILRNPHEILSSRGGDAPNRSHIIDIGDATCVRPFHELIVKADGSIPLCCSDPLGKSIMGNAYDNSLQEIWQGEKYIEARKAIRKGRRNWHQCKMCDYLGIW